MTIALHRQQIIINHVWI